MDSIKEFDGRIKIRYDTSENWEINNPILLKGEIGVTSDSTIPSITINQDTEEVIYNNEFAKITDYKIGDGINHWNDLALHLDTVFNTLTYGLYDTFNHEFGEEISGKLDDNGHEKDIIIKTDVTVFDFNWNDVTSNIFGIPTEDYNWIVENEYMYYNTISNSDCSEDTFCQAVPEYSQLTNLAPIIITGDSKYMIFAKEKPADNITLRTVRFETTRYYEDVAR